MENQEMQNNTADPAHPADAATGQAETSTLARYPAGEAPNLRVLLCSSEGMPLSWKEVGPVTVTVARLDGEDHPVCPFECPEQTSDDRAMFGLQLPAKRMVQIDVKTKNADNGHSSSFMPLVTLVDCEGPAPLARIFERKQLPGPEPTHGLTTLAIQAHWCSKKAGRHDRVRTAEIVSATAEQIPYPAAPVDTKDALAVQQPSHPVQATVHSGTALLSLQSGRQYAVDIRLKEKYARSSPPLPFTLPVCWAGDQEFSICLEPCERVVALFFVNSCGQPANPVDVFVENRGQALAVAAGACTVSGAEIGTMRLFSSSLHLEPAEIHVDERMAQAHAIQATPRTLEGKKLAPLEKDDFILEFDQLPRGKTSVEVLNPHGKVIANLKPDANGQFVYPAKPNDEFDFVARVDGRVVERIRMKAN